MEEQPAFVSSENLLEQARFLRSLVGALVGRDGEDLEQSVWLRALERPPRNQDRVRAWFARVARNLVYENARKATRRSRRESLVRREEALPSAVQVVEHQEQLALVARSVRELPEPYRTTVHLRYFRDMPPTEIADRLHLPLATVKSRLRRALAMLRESMDRKNRGERRGWVVALGPLLAGGEGARAGRSAAPTGFSPALGLAAALLLPAVCLVPVLLTEGGGDTALGPAGPIPDRVARADGLARKGEGAAAGRSRRPLGRDRGRGRPLRLLVATHGSGAPLTGARVRYLDPSRLDAGRVAAHRYDLPADLAAWTRTEGGLFRTGPGGFVTLPAPLQVGYVQVRVGPLAGFGLVGRSGPHRVELAPYGEMVFQAVDPAGRPRSGVHLVVWAGPPVSRRLRARLVTSGPEGMARLPRSLLLGPEGLGSARELAVAPCGAAPDAALALSPTGDGSIGPIKVPLPPAGWLVVQMPGSPGAVRTARARVGLALAPSPGGGRDPHPVEGVAVVRDGQALFAGLPLGRTFTIAAVGDPTWSREVQTCRGPTRPGQVVTVRYRPVLRRVAPIHLRVVDSQGAAMPHTPLRIRRGFMTGEGGHGFRGLPGAVSLVRTDGRGRCSIERIGAGPGGSWAERPGSSAVRALAVRTAFHRDPRPRGATIPVPSRRAATPEEPCVARLEPSSLGGAGRVVDGRGRGVPGAPLRIGALLGSGNRRVWEVIGRTRADGSGRFAWYAFSVSDRYRVDIRSSEFIGAGPFPMGWGCSTLTLPVVRCGRIRGVVRAGPGVDLRRFVLRLVPLEAGGSRVFGRPEADALFHFRGVPPGLYSLEATLSPRGRPIRALEGLVLSPGRCLGADSPLLLDLREWTRAVRLILRDPGGRPPASARVRVLGEPDRELRAENGVVRLILADRPLRCRVTAPGYEPAVVSGLDRDRTVVLRPLPR